MGLALSLLGRCADRWQVRIEIDAGAPPRALTVALVTEAGRRLGPAVVVPLRLEPCLYAELRGPAVLPPGTRIVATADFEDGYSQRVESVVDARRGLHAFLHADGRLQLDSDPRGSALSRVELARLAQRFPWVAGCCGEKAYAGVDAACGEGAPGEADSMVDMLCNEFDVDPDDLDEELLAALRR